MQPHARLPETLAELFNAHSGRNGMGAPRLSASELDKLRALCKGELPFSVGDVEMGVRDAYHAALDVNLMEIFLKAWAKIPAIAAMADANKYPPAERHLVPLGEHHVTSSHEPRVEVLIDKIPAFSVPLDVSLEFDFEGAVLNIAGGHIDAVKSACCRASGSVTCRNVVIASVNTGNMALKDELKLKPPFPLRAAAQQAGLTLSGFDEAGRPLTFRFLPKSGSKEATWLIGRREGRADFVIPNKTVSAEHARIRFSSGKGMEICDLDSSNGTRVDGKLVDRSYTSLAGAQKIVFGFCEMQVSRD
jgi:FHA domain